MIRLIGKIGLPLLLLIGVVGATYALTPEEKVPTSYDLLDAMGTKTVHNFIQPQYRALEASTKQLHTQMDRLCKAPSSQDFADVKASFQTVVTHWSAASIVQFGAMSKTYHKERFHYWPDRKGRGAKAVRLILKKQNSTYVHRAGLAKKSIAVQGLPALELIFFGKAGQGLGVSPHEPSSAFACAYAAAIASNLHQIAGNVLAHWETGGADIIALTQLSPDNQRYTSNKEIVLEIYKAIAEKFKMITQSKLGPALGKDKDHMRAHHLPFWRSHKAVGAVRHEVKSIWNVLEKSGFADLLSLADPHTKKLLAERFQRMDEMFAQLPKDTQVLLGEEPYRSELSAINQDLIKLHKLLEGRMAIAADLPMGFNASDGD